MNIFDHPIKVNYHSEGKINPYALPKESEDKKNNIVGYLKREIPKGTVIVDLYDDGDLYYYINRTYYPIDLNNGKHSDFVSASK